MTEPIERRNVYELIADRLTVLIGDDRLQPGDVLPTERELTQSYRVGRSSVREALRMLESTGLIRPIGNRTFAVADRPRPLNHSLHLLLALRETDLRELFEVRKFLEVEAAGLAASRRTRADLDTLRRAITDMVSGLSAQEPYIEADLRFHLAIATATRNRIAVHIMQAIRDLLHQALASIYHIPGSPERSIQQHRRILEAIAGRDASGARERMRDHLVRVEGDIRDALSAHDDANRRGVKGRARAPLARSARR